jgi:hypothetical protein
MAAPEPIISCHEEPPGASRQTRFTQAGSGAIEHDGEASSRVLVLLAMWERKLLFKGLLLDASLHVLEGP